MKRILVLLLVLVGLYAAAFSRANRAYEFCQQAKGLPSTAIEARLGEHYEVRNGEHRYDPSWLYALLFSDDIGVRYDRNWNAISVSCGA